MARQHRRLVELADEVQVLLAIEALRRVAKKSSDEVGPSSTGIFFFYRVLRGILRYLKGVASVGFVVGQAEALAGVVGGVLVALVGADPRIDADGLQRADLARPHPNEARIQTARPVVTA